MSSPAPLRVLVLAYRGNPHSGGQGVYTRYLAKELVELGHEVDVLSGPPYPEMDGTGATLHELESMDLYRPERPFRPHRLPRDRYDWLELGIMSTGAFCEPRPFSLRANAWMKAQGDRWDVVHDNQCLGHRDGEDGRAAAAARDRPPPDHRRQEARAGRDRATRGGSSRSAAGTRSSGCRSACSSSCRG